MTDQPKAHEVPPIRGTSTKRSFDFVRQTEKKGVEKANHEEIAFNNENEDREKIMHLTYNVVNDAMKEIPELNKLIGDTKFQKPNIEEMCAFRHNDGRILLGSIKHVTEAFNKYSHYIGEADLKDLKVGEKNNAHGIERMKIDEGLITILKERGFKADIAKRGTNGELKKVGTLHAKWNAEKHGMEMKFENYEGDQSDWRKGNSSHSYKAFVHVPPDGTSNQDSGSETVETVISINNPHDGETYYDALGHFADADVPALIGNSEMTEATQPEKPVAATIEANNTAVTLKKLETAAGDTGTQEVNVTTEASKVINTSKILENNINH